MLLFVTSAPVLYACYIATIVCNTVTIVRNNVTTVCTGRTKPAYATAWKHLAGGVANGTAVTSSTTEEIV